MNAIAALIAKGYVDDLIAAADPGETYHLGRRGAQTSSDSFPDKIKQIHRAMQEAAPEGCSLMIWLSRSADGKRAMGEILLDKGENTPAIVWAIGEERAPHLDYGESQNVVFSSASERLEIMGDPISFLELVGHPRCQDAIDMVRRLGYAPQMVFSGDLRVTFRKLELENADA